MATATQPVYADFFCSPETVWRVLCDAASYGNWFGFPKLCGIADKKFVFAAGAKVEFEDSHETNIVTSFDPPHVFEISGSRERNTISITQTDFGCRVSVVTEFNSFRGEKAEAEGRELINEQLLSRLKGEAYREYDENESFETNPILPIRRSGKLRSIIKGTFSGFRSPIEERKGQVAESVELSSLIDTTESDVKIHLRAVIAALCLCVLFVFVLSVAVSFERSDIVPSSGLSVTESLEITKENAARIRIGQAKNELELMLNCRGLRISPNEYYYRSSDKNELGDSKRKIFVTYDAYGKVRRYAYIDYTLADTGLSGAFRHPEAEISFDMGPVEAEKAVGQKLTSFSVDKSGVTTLNFGRLKTDDNIFSPNIKAELVIVVDKVKEYATADYYQPYSRDNPLPDEETTELLSRQYTNWSYYIADRAAYERVFLLLGRDRAQVDAVLGTEGADYALTYNNGIICSYSNRSPVADEAAYRYRYDVTYYEDEIAAEITMRNAFLLGKVGVLLNSEDYKFEKGMSMFDVYRQLEILPSLATVNFDTVTLCYGERMSQGTEVEHAYPIVIVFEITGWTVIEYHYNY